MELLNTDVVDDIANGTPLQLELGSGGGAKEGFYAVDHLALPGVDIVADLNKPLSLLPDNSVSYIYTRHTLEHVEQFLPLMQEIWRVAKPDAQIEIIVPHFSNVLAYSDPTHVRFFGLYTMFYFVDKDDQPSKRKVPAFYSDTRFYVDSLRIQFYRLNLFDRLTVPILAALVNSSLFGQEFYERRLSGLLRAWQITYKMRPKK
jgi:SAM-dependent methyltransferase